jgi:hypothetical protein
MWGRRRCKAGKRLTGDGPLEGLPVQWRGVRETKVLVNLRIRDDSVSKCKSIERSRERTKLKVVALVELSDWRKKPGTFCDSVVSTGRSGTQRHAAHLERVVVLRGMSPFFALARSGVRDDDGRVEAVEAHLGGVGSSREAEGGAGEEEEAGEKGEEARGHDPGVDASGPAAERSRADNEVGASSGGMPGTGGRRMDGLHGQGFMVGQNDW